MKTLSVIVVNYNTGKFLAECLESVRQTTNGLENPKTEVIVIDNASKDESIKSIKGITGIKSIKSKTNVGFAKAVNQGIKVAKGRYILLLNPDTKVKNDAIREMVEFVQSTDDVGVVGARLLNPDGSTQASTFHFPTVWGAISEFWLGQGGVYSKYTPEGDKPSVVDAVVGAVFLVTPQARETVGLLDERYFMYFEDLDYCKRVWKSGLKVYYLPSAVVVHYHGASGKGISDEANQWRRLVPSSKLYHGLLKHYLINFVIWSGLKFRRIFGLRN